MERWDIAGKKSLQRPISKQADRHYITELNLSIRDVLEGLQKRGFHINKGYKDCGVLLAVWQKAGGYYLGAYSLLQMLISVSLLDLFDDSYS